MLSLPALEDRYRRKALLRVYTPVSTMTVVPPSCSHNEKLQHVDARRPLCHAQHLSVAACTTSAAHYLTLQL